MHTARKIAMLNALGVIAYSRVRQAKVRLESNLESDQRAAAKRSDAIAAASIAAVSISPVFLRTEQAPLPAAPLPAPALIVLERAAKAALVDAERAAKAALARPAARLPIANRVASVRTELVLPSAEIERFLGSRMYSHFCLLFANGAAIPVIENTVVSDTALHFEQPPKAPLKLGSMALLRSAWRAKRQAWLAIRLWRKQQQ